MKFSKIILPFLLFSSLSSHAGSNELIADKKDPVFLYYPIQGQNSDSRLYIGKVFFFGAIDTGFTRFQEIINEGCDQLVITVAEKRVCKINEYLAADKNNREAMVKTIINHKIIFPTPNIVRVAL